MFIYGIFTIYSLINIHINILSIIFHSQRQKAVTSETNNIREN